MLNTEEFYKELFEKYSFDQDKIRLAAIKQAKEPAAKRAVRMYWKPAAGIAAAVAVTVGVTAYAARGIGGGVNITVSPASALSASQRMYEAERSYYSAMSEEEDIKNIYVTFNSPVSFSDISLALSAVTDSDDISIEHLYITDGSIFAGKEAISVYADTSGSTKSIAAAKLCAPAGLYRSIQDLPSVYLAELGSEEINDRTFVPIEIDDSDPLMGDRMTETQAVPPVTTTPFSFEQQTSAPVEVQQPVTSVGTDNTPEFTDTVLPAETDIGETDIPETDETDIPEIIPSESGETSVPYETDVPADSMVSSSEETSVSSTEVPISEISDIGGQGLMTEMYDLNVPNALETHLIDNYAVVLTKTQVYIYSLGGFDRMSAAQAADISSPSVAYADSDSIIITGCGADGTRNTIMHINAKENYVTVTDAAPFIGGAEIGTIQYSAASGKYYIKVVSSEKTYIYECITSAESGFAFRPLFESSTAVSLAGSANGKLYYFVQNENLGSILREFNCSNGQIRDIAEFETTCKTKRSPTFESFAIIPSDDGETCIFDTTSASIISAEVTADTAVAVSCGKTYFRSGDKTFVISGSIITETSANGIRFVIKPASDFYVKETDSEKVTVVKHNRYYWQS